MGTPAWAVPVLRQLIAHAASAPWELAGVVTQPDRRQGRKRQHTVHSPVKTEALAHDLPLLQPATFRRNPAAVAQLASWQPDLIVVAAFGQILPRTVLRLPAQGCINVHASLLPALRGASPIAEALLSGLSVTGTSIMLMDAGMDTGPVLAQARMPIAPDDTTLCLGERLSHQGAALLVETLPRWLAGQIEPQAQDALPGTVSVCSLWQKEKGLIDWQQSGRYIERQVRACYPWPCAYTQWQGQLFKIWEATWHPVAGSCLLPGQIEMTASGLGVHTGEGMLILRKVQLAGKKAMAIRAFLTGAGRTMPGTRFDLQGPS